MKNGPAPLVVDGRHLATAKVRASQADPSVRDSNLREVAHQFESLFTHMLLKNMRAASLGEGAMDSEQSNFYRDMFDQQMASELSSGRGLGIADLLVRQLSGQSPPSPPQAALAYRRAGAMAPAQTAAGPAQAQKSTSSPAKNEATALAFVKRLAPHAARAAQRLQVAPQFLLAQAALETGWGKHMIRGPDGANSNNLFGIKASDSWQGARVNTTTREFEGDQARTTTAQFRAYMSEAESFADYAGLLLGSPRYRSALNQGDNGHAFAHGLQRGGYATDPKYADKILRIADSETMREALEALKIPLSPPLP